jgi:LysR family transcriptional regulator, transcriptional activator for bauABCD operon
VFRYICQFLAIVRRSPEPSRAARVFQACLLQAHGDPEMERPAPNSYG